MYDFCVQGTPDNDVVVRGSADGKEALQFLTRQVSGQHSYHWMEDPVTSLISSGYLGPEACRELLESYYRTRAFRFAHHELLLLGTFLKIDKFGTDLIPAHHVRHLHLQIQPYSYRSMHSSEPKDPNEILHLQGIEALSASLTTRSKVIINIDLATGFEDDDYCAQPLGGHCEELCLSQIDRVIKVLSDKGLQMKTVYSRTWDG